MPNQDEVRLWHMRDAARQALEFAKGRRRRDLDQDLMLVFALVRALEIVGEAAGRISEPTRARVHGIAWVDIVGMRHRLIHAYFDVDLDILWRTVEVDLPPLIAALDRAIGER